MTKNSTAWIFIGIALILISPMLADKWYQGYGLIQNLQEGSIWRDIPLKVPVIAGVLSILWGAYLRVKNSK